MNLSILIPSIRTNRWDNLLASIRKACKNNKYEVLFIGPFVDKQVLEKYPEARHMEEFGSPSRAIQIGMFNVKYDTVFLTVDDCTIFEDSLDVCLEQYQSECSGDDVLLMRYKEGSYIYTAADYRAGHHDALRINNVNPEWMIAPQFIMNTNKFVSMGGFDCIYEYNNEAVHDFMFRLQMLGGKIIPSVTHACEATHYPGTTADHAPIHNAQLGHDYPIFVDKYTRGDIDLIIDFHNWKNSPAVWDRRFSKGVVHTYDDLIQSEGYAF
jgi:hypothetical protein